MKWLVRALLSLVALAALFGAANYFATERVEVVTLHTLDASGAAQETRLWVLDHDGAAFLRTSPGSGWHARTKAMPNVEVTRGDERARYTLVERLDLREPINTGFQEKYTWGDSFISAMLGGRTDSIPLELVAVDAPAA